MWINILLAVAGFTIFLYVWMTRNYGYFRSRGLPEVPSSFPFGSAESARVLTGRLAFTSVCDEIYRQYKQLPVVGYFFASTPVLVVNDLELARQILVKDFDHFADRRRLDVDGSVDANARFKDMLISMEGDGWRKVRGMLSPIFTTGKLKVMTRIINKVGDDFVATMEAKSNSREDFDVRDVMVNYTLDTIASCGFGVEANSLKDPGSKFKAMVNKMTGSGNVRGQLRVMMIVGFPKLAKLLKLSFFDKEGCHFLIDVIHQTLAYRKANNARRNDFIDLTLDALKNEVRREVEDDQFEKDAVLKPVGEAREMSGEELERHLIANLLILFIAGFETSSTILSVASYFLAKNRDVQERLLNEIRDVLADAADLSNLDYGTVNSSLPYLDMFVRETLRMYPIAFIERRCTRPFKIPGTKFTIPVGMLVQISAGGIMMDPQHYSDPKVFNPEHFSPESKRARNPYAFLPFGQGPRNCLGMRFALMNIKMCLIRLVHDFRVLPTAKMPGKLVIDPLSQSNSPIGGVRIRVEKRTR